MPKKCRLKEQIIKHSFDLSPFVRTVIVFFPYLKLEGGLEFFFFNVTPFLKFRMYKKTASLNDAKAEISAQFDHSCCQVFIMPFSNNFSKCFIQLLHLCDFLPGAIDLKY